MSVNKRTQTPGEFVDLTGSTPVTTLPLSPRCRLDQRATSRAPRAPLCEGEPWGLEGRQRSRNGGGWEEVTVASVVTAGGALGRRVQLGQGRGCLTRWNFPGVTTASQRVPPRGGGAAPQSLGPQVRRSPLADLPPACRPGPRFTGHCQPPAGLSSFWPRGSVLGLPQATPSGLPVPCRSRSPSAPAPQLLGARETTPAQCAHTLTARGRRHRGWGLCRHRWGHASSREVSEPRVCECFLSVGKGGKEVQPVLWAVTVSVVHAVLSSGVSCRRCAVVRVSRGRVFSAELRAPLGFGPACSRPRYLPHVPGDPRPHGLLLRPVRAAQFLEGAACRARRGRAGSAVTGASLAGPPAGAQGGMGHSRSGSHQLR